jgi:DnaJ-like protein
MISPSTDLYAILQVAPDAETEVIDAAYRQLMRKYHPDVARGDQALAAQLHERAKLINQAYAILRDPRQRREYDRARQQDSRDASARPRPGSPPGSSSSPSGSRGSPRASDPAGSPGSAGSKGSAGSPGGVGSPGSSARRGWASPSSGQVPASGSVPPASAAQRPVHQPAAAPSVAYHEASNVEQPGTWWVVDAPLSLLASAYYLLPGPYEWEPASKREQLFTWLIPPLGVLAWMAGTGRLTPLLGRSPYAVLLVWLLASIVLLIADWRSMPRFAVAGGLALVLTTGVLDAQLVAAGVPIWLGWLAIGGLGVLLAARAFFFGLLPTMGVCWLLGRIG